MDKMRSEGGFKILVNITVCSQEALCSISEIFAI